MRNKAGRVIYDRRFNVASMLAQYYGGGSPGGSSSPGGSTATTSSSSGSSSSGSSSGGGGGGAPLPDFAGRIQWDPNDPNILRLRMPGAGPDVRTRVTRRSQTDKPGERRLETSEFMEQVMAVERCWWRWGFSSVRAAFLWPSCILSGFCGSADSPPPSARLHTRAHSRTNPAPNAHQLGLFPTAPPTCTTPRQVYEAAGAARGGGSPAECAGGACAGLAAS